MRLGVRGRLFGVSLLVIVAVGLTSGLYLERALGRWMRGRLEQRLIHLALGGVALVEASGVIQSPEQGDRLAERLQQASELHVSLTDARGVVVGDSGRTLEELRRRPELGARPEIVQALAGEIGVDWRYSSAVGQEMLFVAVPYRAPGGGGVVRVATPLAEIDAATLRLREVFLVAAALGLLLAVAMSALASHLFSRTLLGLAARAERLATGAGQGRLAVAGGDDELSGLVGSLNQMAEALDSALDRLATERDRLRAVLEGMRDAVLTVDAQHEVTLANSAARRLLSVAGEPAGRSVYELLRRRGCAPSLRRPPERRGWSFSSQGRLAGGCSPTPPRCERARAGCWCFATSLRCGASRRCGATSWPTSPTSCARP